MQIKKYFEIKRYIYYLPLLGFYMGYQFNNYNLKTGDILLTNLKDKEGNVVSEVILIGDRKGLKKEQKVICEEFILYDEKGNRLLRLNTSKIKENK